MTPCLLQLRLELSPPRGAGGALSERSELSKPGWGTHPTHRAPNRHPFICPTPRLSGHHSLISKKTYARCFAPPYIPLIPSHCEVATNGLRGELGITGVVPWWAKAGAEADGTVPPPSTRRMPESTPTRRRDEGPISCRLPAWTLVPPRPLQIPAASSLTSPDGPADASARPVKCKSSQRLGERARSGSIGQSAKQTPKNGTPGLDPGAQVCRNSTDERGGAGA